MALRIESPEADSLARELAKTTGESVTQAVIVALRERLEREKHRPPPGPGGLALAADLLRIAQECADLPVLDPRTPEEIMGYDENGLPT
jgi:antitoxin VapB